MTYDLDLLRIVAEKDKYERFKDVVKKHNVSSITLDLFTTLGDYWDNYPSHSVCDWGTLRTFFYIVKGKKLKKPEQYELAFDNLCAPPATSPAMMDDIIKKLVEMDYATRIYNEVLGISTGRAGSSLSTIGPLLSEYERELGIITKDADVFVSPSLSYISSVVTSKGLSWRLKELNVSVGPLRKGDFIILGARPETGKTTMVASEATYMLPQLEVGEVIIWVNNEESSKKVMARCIQSYFGITTGDLMANIAKYEADFLEEGGKQLLIVDDDSGLNSVHKLDALFKKYKVGLIVFDQLDKVEGFKNERQDLHIGGLYEWARGLAKKYCPVIAISQLDGTAEGEKYPGMEKLRGSKTDKPGEADVVITIGNMKDGTLNRYISIDKNKLFGGPETIEAHRHGKFEVEIDPPRARFISKWTTKH